MSLANATSHKSIPLNEINRDQIELIRTGTNWSQTTRLRLWPRTLLYVRIPRDPKKSLNDIFVHVLVHRARYKDETIYDDERLTSTAELKKNPDPLVHDQRPSGSNVPIQIRVSQSVGR